MNNNNNDIRKKRGRPKKNDQVVEMAINTIDDMAENKFNAVSQAVLNFDSDGEEYKIIDNTGNFDNDDFLAELSNKNYVKPVAKKEELQSKRLEVAERKLKMQEEQLYLNSMNPQPTKKHNDKKNISVKKFNAAEEDDELFDSQGSQILGKDKRVLIAKLGQYKSLFKAELKNFKVKESASVDELKQYLIEMETIVNTSNVDDFLTSSLIECVRIIEGPLAKTKSLNIKGLADMLKANTQFHRLTKQLYIKYKIFSAIDPEYQLMFLVATSAYICKCKNDKVGKFDNDFLNSQIPINQTF
jgi:hypothetical protein